MIVHNFFNSLCSYCSIPPTYSSALSKKQPDHYKIKIVIDGREVFVWFEVQMMDLFIHWFHKTFLLEFSYCQTFESRLFYKRKSNYYKVFTRHYVDLFRTANLKKINHAKTLGLQKLLGKIEISITWVFVINHTSSFIVVKSRHFSQTANLRQFLDHA